MENMIKNIFIERKNIKNFNLRVTPKMDVFLSVPIDSTQKQINQFLIVKENWIKKQLVFFKERLESPQNKDFISGERFSYLGRNYKLKVVENNLEECKFEKGQIFIYIKDKDNKSKKQQLLEKWFREKSKSILNKVFLEQLELFNEKDDVILQIRTMTTMWGSCNKSKRKIILNSKLIQKKRSFINYVVAHEVAHLKYSNHSPDFYEWLSVNMPNWKEAEKTINKNNRSINEK